ncbi:NAD-binding protein [Lentzea alba]|uniref:NAD-binding protein n=1 Tax=Lentzea alba TaxID=2714351 RepID=UPI0039BEEE58
MGSHTVLIGYSTRGRALLAALCGDGRATDFTVIDADPERVEQAVLDGVNVVAGSGWSLRVLWAAAAHVADHVVVAVTDDAMALRITSVVRSLNETAVVITVVRRTELRDLIEFLGADHVLTADQADEWTLTAAGSAFEHVEVPDLAWVVAERAVRSDEIGCAPLTCGHQVLAVVRDGRRVWAEDPAVAALRGDDRLLVLSSVPVGD